VWKKAIETAVIIRGLSSAFIIDLSKN